MTKEQEERFNELVERLGSNDCVEFEKAKEELREFIEAISQNNFSDGVMAGSSPFGGPY